MAASMILTFVLPLLESNARDFPKVDANVLLKSSERNASHSCFKSEVALKDQNGFGRVRTSNCLCTEADSASDGSEPNSLKVCRMKDVGLG